MPARIEERAEEVVARRRGEACDRDARPSGWVARTCDGLGASARPAPAPIRRGAPTGWPQCGARRRAAAARRSARPGPRRDPEWSVSRTAAPASRRSATCAASHSRPSSSRPENGSSSSSSGHPDWSASSSATRWSMPRLRVAAGRSRTAGSRPLTPRAASQSVAAAPRSARIARSHSPQRRRAEADLLGPRRRKPRDGAASPRAAPPAREHAQEDSSCRCPFARRQGGSPGRGRPSARRRTARCAARAGRERPRLERHRHPGHANDARAPGPQAILRRDLSRVSVVMRHGPDPRRPRRAVHGSVDRRRASVAVADPRRRRRRPPSPWVGNGPTASTAPGHVAALVTSNGTPPPGTASSCCA